MSAETKAHQRAALRDFFISNPPLRKASCSLAGAIVTVNDGEPYRRPAKNGRESAPTPYEARARRTRRLARRPGFGETLRSALPPPSRSLEP
jgi:hypothetical protein